MSRRSYDDEEGPVIEIAVLFTGVETENAYMVVDPATDEEHWIPFSQTTKRDGKLKGGEGTITITEWIAKKKGLI